MKFRFLHCGEEKEKLVHCNECKYWYRPDDSMLLHPMCHHPIIGGFAPTEECYCSFGRRLEDFDKEDGK